MTFMSLAMARLSLLGLFNSSFDLSQFFEESRGRLGDCALLLSVRPALVWTSFCPAMPHCVGEEENIFVEQGIWRQNMRQLVFQRCTLCSPVVTFLETGGTYYYLRSTTQRGLSRVHDSFFKKAFNCVLSSVETLTKVVNINSYSVPCEKPTKKLSTGQDKVCHPTRVIVHRLWL